MLTSLETNFICSNYYWLKLRYKATHAKDIVPASTYITIQWPGLWVDSCSVSVKTCLSPTWIGAFHPRFFNFSKSIYIESKWNPPLPYIRIWMSRKVKVLINFLCMPASQLGKEVNLKDLLNEGFRVHMTSDFTERTFTPRSLITVNSWGESTPSHLIQLSVGVNFGNTRHRTLTVCKIVKSPTYDKLHVDPQEVLLSWI